MQKCAVSRSPMTLLIASLALFLAASAQSTSSPSLRGGVGAAMPTCSCDTNDFSKEMQASVLNMHNMLRHANSVGQLTWDCELQCSAQDWVDTVARLGDCPEGNCHSRAGWGYTPVQKSGENVFGVVSGGFNADAAFLTFKWFLEWSVIPEHAAGHFKTVSMPGFDRVGCGYRSPGLFVCQYRGSWGTVPDFCGTMDAYAFGGFTKADIDQYYEWSGNDVNEYLNMPRARDLLGLGTQPARCPTVGGGPSPALPSQCVAEKLFDGGCQEHFSFTYQQYKDVTLEQCLAKCRAVHCGSFAHGVQGVSRADWCNVYSGTCTNNGDMDWVMYIPSSAC